MDGRKLPPIQPSGVMMGSSGPSMSRIADLTLSWMQLDMIRRCQVEDGRKRKKGAPKKGSFFILLCILRLFPHLFKYVHNTPVPTWASLTLIILGLRITSDDQLFYLILFNFFIWFLITHYYSCPLSNFNFNYFIFHGHEKGTFFFKKITSMLVGREKE
jgi:hypothetical protein